VGSLVLLFFAVIGKRAVFAVPIDPGASWILRITLVHGPGAYFAATRRSLYALAVAPVWTASAITLLAIWPLFPAMQHLTVMAIAGVLLVEIGLHRVRKIPFACSYLPGKANLHVRLGAGGIGFLFAANQGVQIEYWAMQRPMRYAVFLAILAAWAFWAWRRTREFAASPENRLQFDDLPPADLTQLDLHAEAEPAIQ
jgi:hypothetical protein